MIGRTNANSNLGQLTHTDCGSGMSFSIDVDWNKNDRVYIEIKNGTSLTSENYNEFGYIDKNNNKVAISSDWGTRIIPNFCNSTVTNTGITLNFSTSNAVSVIIIHNV